MRKRFLVSPRSGLSWLVACAIVVVVVNVQCLSPLLVESFRIPRPVGTQCGTMKRTMRAGSDGARGSPLVAAGGAGKATPTRLFDRTDDDETEEQPVEVGSKEYYSGFLSSPIQDETVAERGSGLEQAVKLGGGVVLVLVVLLAGFMASNGLL